MGIDVTAIDRDDLHEWDQYVAQSPQGTLFHRSEALLSIASHTDATLHLLVGYKGEEPIGLLPLFELEKGPVATAFSPPPKVGIPYLGPVLLNYRKRKQRKRERTNNRFIEECLEWLDGHVNPKFVHIETSPEYSDPRPFHWAEYDVTPRYTYMLDLSVGADALFDQFKSNLRSHIRRNRDEEYRVSVGSRDAVEYIVERVNTRYEEQDESFALDPDYVVALWEQLPEGNLQPYIGEVEGAWESGILVAAFDARLSYWQGGVKPETDFPINDLLHWHIIQDGIDRGHRQYDLVGANTPRISAYKARYNPTLKSYYEIERGSLSMNIAANLYRTFR